MYKITLLGIIDPLSLWNILNRKAFPSVKSSIKNMIFVQMHSIQNHPIRVLGFITVGYCQHVSLKRVEFDFLTLEIAEGKQLKSKDLETCNDLLEMMTDLKNPLDEKCEFFTIS